MPSLRLLAARSGHACVNSLGHPNCTLGCAQNIQDSHAISTELRYLRRGKHQLDVRQPSTHLAGRINVAKHVGIHCRHDNVGQPRFTLFDPHLAPEGA